MRLKDQSPPTSQDASKSSEAKAKSTGVPNGYVRKRKGLVKNTSSPPTLQTRLTRQLAGIMAHLELHPNDGLSRARVSKIQDLLRR